MIALVYDSLFGNTAQIAHTMADEAKTIGFEVLEMNVNKPDFEVLGKAEILLIGSPTQAFGASKPMLEFLGKISSESVQNKKVVVFDTRIDLDTKEQIPALAG